MDIIVHSVTEKKNKRRITSQSEFYSFGPVFHDDKENKKTAVWLRTKISRCEPGDRQKK